MGLPKEAWDDFEKHPCWVEIVKMIESRIMARESELESEAYKGVDMAVIIRLAAEIKALKWVRELPKNQKLGTQNQKIRQTY